MKKLSNGFFKGCYLNMSGKAHKIVNAKVLLVEDHKNLAKAVGAYLESSGFAMD